MPSSFTKMDNRHSSPEGYTRQTISKTHGEQKWLLLVKNLEQVSIFVFNADTAPI